MAAVLFFKGEINVADLMKKLPNFKIFSGSVLKLIAIITMLIDHMAVIVLSDTEWAITPFLNLGSKGISVYFLLRKIGRLAFPIFCFLIAEGFIHTKNRKNYGINLIIFAFISEIPFNLMISGKMFYFGTQNIYFTLLLGFLLLCVIDSNISGIKKFILFLFLILIVKFLRCDYGLNGVLLIGIIYYLRENKALQALFSYPLLSGGLAAWAAFLPINMYNGKRGFIKGNVFKYLFYVFYPLHIIILVLIKRYLL